jgi:hypothetical protein
MNGQLNKTAADEVAFWRSLVQKIQADIATAESALAASEARRREHALAASLGDHEAKKRLESVLDDDRRAERELQDSKLALQQAEVELGNAENARRVEQGALRKKAVERLARARVAAAEEIDKAFADFSKAWATFETLGSELLGIASQDQNANALYLSETISGEARLAASLPAKPFLAIRERFNFMPISTSKSFAAAEASYWRLSPPVEEVKAA